MTDALGSNSCASNELVWCYACRQYAADLGRVLSEVCTKYTYNPRDRSPGVFLVHCLDCGNTVGFTVMDHHESPRTLFDTVFQRWPIPPLLIVYDNACNAHDYALNREPGFFKGTTFLVDAMHFKTHKSCAHAYDIKRHVTHAQLNSQLAEQRVSKICALLLDSPGLPICGSTAFAHVLLTTYVTSGTYELATYLCLPCRTPSWTSSRSNAAS
jgi:hypothetical protein